MDPIDGQVLRHLYEQQTWHTRKSVREAVRGNVLPETVNDAIDALVRRALVEKSRGQGGRLALTELGVQFFLDEHDDAESYEKLGKESTLYPYVQDALRKRADDLVMITGGLKMRRGQWTNPDLVQVSFRELPLLGTRNVEVVSYEVKTWDDWSIKGVFEAAAHASLAHRAWLVLEWAKGLAWDAVRFERWTERMVTECGRFGIGLMTLHPGEPVFSLRTHLLAQRATPDERLTEAMLEYYLRKLDLRAEFESMRKRADSTNANDSDDQA